MLPFFDWNIAYYVKTNQYNQQAYVYIFKINLKLNEYDLQTPPNLKENKEIFRLKESDLHRMIKECIKNVFKETYYKQYNNRLLENKNRHKDIMPLNRSIPNRYL